MFNGKEETRNSWCSIFFEGHKAIAPIYRKPAKKTGGLI